MNYNEIIKECYSYSDLCKKLNFYVNGTGMRKVKEIIEKYNLDISHFDYGLRKKIKYKRVYKICPTCSNKFETLLDNRDEKVTCSKSCANTYFRSGKNNPNWRNDSNNYRKTCFEFNKKECIICGENRIVEVHHLDGNRSNNDISNLIPLCPTHHSYWHSEYRYIIEDKIYNFVKNNASVL